MKSLLILPIAAAWMSTCSANPSPKESSQEVAWTEYDEIQIEVDTGKINHIRRPRDQFMCVTGQRVYDVKDCRPLKPGESLVCVDTRKEKLRQTFPQFDFYAYSPSKMDPVTVGVGCRLTQ